MPVAALADIIIPSQPMHGIGNTPFIKLNARIDSGCADIYVKFEGANLTGSMKDRMALSMIEGGKVLEKYWTPITYKKTIWW